MITRLVFLLVLASPGHCFAQFQFVSPRPGSVHLPIQHNIIIRQGQMLKEANATLFSISGIKSGKVPFRMIVCDDNKTLNLNPLQYFAYDDTIQVQVQAGAIQTEDQGTNTFFQFTFTTISQEMIEERKRTGESEYSSDEMIETVEKDQAAQDDSLVKLYSIITNLESSYQGNVFFDCRPADSQTADSAYQLISVIKNNGDSVFQQSVAGFPYDFHLGRNGYFITYRGDKKYYAMLDSNFHMIDTFSMANGFSSDPHDCRLTDDGYAFVIGVEDQSAGGEKNQVYRGSVIQQFDRHRNIIFEWRSVDWIDATETTHLNEDAGLLDYVHTNSIEIDWDGHLITSNRNIDQINKIDVNTGEFIWRLGGLKNEFTFINDAEQFSRQHDCRRLINGHITIYDNGNYHTPPHSSAKEYRLDEVQKTATLVWSYTHPPVDGVIPYYPAMGNVQRLENGNTFINWGKRAHTNLPSMTEVDSAGQIVWELKLASDKQYISYRAHKYEWNPCARPSVDSMKTGEVTDHSAGLSWEPVRNILEAYEVQHKIKDAPAWQTQRVPAAVDQFMLGNLQPSTTYYWRVKSWCDTIDHISSGFSQEQSFTTTDRLTDEQVPVLLYPNPAQDYVYVHAPQAKTVHLFNLTGQQVFEITRTSDDTAFKLSLQALPQGLYIVEANNHYAALLSVVK